MDFTKLLENQYVRYVGLLLIGITIGALFYPTSHIEEKMKSKFQEEMSQVKTTHAQELATVTEQYNKVVAESKQYKEESEKKVSILQTEVKSLQSKQKTAYYKLIKPDGTIEIKKFTESEVNESSKVVTSIQEEYKKKVEELQNKWETIHAERLTSIKKDFDSKEQNYVMRISELEKSKVTSINEKKTNVEIGAMTNSDYYGHLSSNVWGPFTLGTHINYSKEDQFRQKPAETTVGGGIGFSF